MQDKSPLPKHALVAVFVLLLFVCSVSLSAAFRDKPSRLQSLMGELSREITKLETEIGQLRADNAELRRRLGADVTPPAPPRPAAPDKVWRCAICGKPLVLDNVLAPKHAAGPQDHQAELSKADLQILVDGLRMSD